MSDKVRWVFYDSHAKTQSNPFSTEDAQMAILKMRPYDVARYLIWATGWQTWLPLMGYLESDQKNFRSSFNLPKNNDSALDVTQNYDLEATQTQAFQNKKEDTKSFSDIQLNEETIGSALKKERAKEAVTFDGDEITWSNIQKPTLDFSKIGPKKLGNRETRHELKIEVVLISTKGKSFRSRSKNISLSGSLLEDSIPFDYYGTVFDVVIINSHAKDPSRARVKLSAKTVGDGLTQRIHYHNPTAEQKKALQSLLEDYIALQKKSSSRAS